MGNAGTSKSKTKDNGPKLANTGNNLSSTRMMSSTSGRNEYDYLFKLVVIGDKGVGKSSLILRFADNTFPETDISTIGVDYKIRTLKIDAHVVKLEVWDAPGEDDKIRSILQDTEPAFQRNHGAIVVYDITNSESFNNIQKHLQELQRYQGNEYVGTILVGNKCDLVNERKVSVEDAKSLADDLDIFYLETSAKNSINVEEVFTKLASSIKERVED
jgi:Ras-related protein Rab-1A